MAMDCKHDYYIRNNSTEGCWQCKADNLQAKNKLLLENNDLLHKFIEDNRITHLQADNERLKEENRWIAVSERLPDIPLGPPNASTEPVWLIFSGKPHIGHYTNFIGWRVYGHGFHKGLNQQDITHWKPIILPEQALKGGE